MKKIYTRKKNNPTGTFYVEAHPDANKWDEYIKIGSTWLHNIYRLNSTTKIWLGSPMWRTFTTSFVGSFEVNFSAPDQTVLTLNGDKNITNSSSFQSWFTYCKQAGVEEILVDIMD
jgi:hypothetical protein